MPIGCCPALFLSSTGESSFKHCLRCKDTVSSSSSLLVPSFNRPSFVETLLERESDAWDRQREVYLRLEEQHRAAMEVQTNMYGRLAAQHETDLRRWSEEREAAATAAAAAAAALEALWAPPAPQPAEAAGPAEPASASGSPRRCSQQNQKEEEEEKKKKKESKEEPRAERSFPGSRRRRPTSSP